MSTDTLVERLRGNYVTSLTGGVRSFAPWIPPISLEAADEIESLETENLVMITLLSGIAAGNNSRKDAAEYIKAMLKRLDTSPEGKTGG